MPPTITSPVYSPGKYRFSSFGINVRNIRGASNTETGNEIEVELAAFRYYPGQQTENFLPNFITIGQSIGVMPCSAPRILPPQYAWTSTRQRRFSPFLMTLIRAVSDQWVTFGTFGVGPSGGGGNGNADWGLTDADKFVAYIFGYSNYMVVNDGQLYGDNFQEDGGVPWVGPLPGPSPGPTGIFRFAFPANNPLLTAILNVTGNYSGRVTNHGPASLQHCCGSGRIGKTLRDGHHRGDTRQERQP